MHIFKKAPNIEKTRLVHSLFACLEIVQILRRDDMILGTKKTIKKIPLKITKKTPPKPAEWVETLKTTSTLNRT